MEIFRTHPSVRVKGTEDNYEPISCTIGNCSKRTLHLHCPFCVKTDIFHDPVILKAHYRVKHVDKGIEFAGLKILRCCDNCMIVGSIKGSKEFKGAHWHCYNCRNGFNRRDEALKHYKTHFRNPMTTFQIQITHDINQMMEMSMEQPTEIQISVDNQHQHQLSVLPGSTTVTNNGNMMTNHALNTVGDSAGMSSWIMSTETVVSSDGANHVVSDGNVILTQKESDRVSDQNIQQVSGIEGLEDAQYYIVGEDGQLTAADVNQVAVTTSTTDHVEVCGTDLVAEKDSYIQRLTEMERKYEELTNEKNRSENLLNQRIMSLELEVQMQQRKTVALQIREQELLTQLERLKNGTQVSNILNEMKSKQEELLDQYMSKLKKTVTSPNEENNGCMENPASKQNPFVEVSNVVVVPPGKVEGGIGGSIPASKGISVTPIKIEKVQVKDRSNIIHVKSENLSYSTSPACLTTIPKSGINTETIVFKSGRNTFNPVNVSPINLATRLPISRLFESKQSPTSDNLNVITTDSGNQYMVVMDGAETSLKPQDVNLPTNANDTLGTTLSVASNECVPHYPQNENESVTAALASPTVLSEQSETNTIEFAVNSSTSNDSFNSQFNNETNRHAEHITDGADVIIDSAEHLNNGLIDQSNGINVTLESIETIEEINSERTELAKNKIEVSDGASIISKGIKRKASESPDISPSVLERPKRIYKPVVKD